MIENIHPALRIKASEYWSDFQFIFKTLYPNSVERDLLEIIETINSAYINRKDSLSISSNAYLTQCDETQTKSNLL